MFRTIQAIATGAAMICLALPTPRAEASGRQAAAPPDDTEPAPLVDPHPVADFAPAIEELPAFVWTSDLSLTPPPYVTATNSPPAPPGETTTAIPLPPAAWTGFVSLAGLGAISLVKRLRRVR